MDPESLEVHEQENSIQTKCIEYNIVICFIGIPLIFVLAILAILKWN